MTVIVLIIQCHSKPNKSGFKKRVSNHPCLNAQIDEVIPTDNGDIICRKPTDNDLDQKLNNNGGFNRNYLAKTLNNARRNFKNMFRVYGKYFDNTTQWNDWLHNRPISTPYVDSIFKLSSQDNVNAKLEEKREVIVEKREAGSVVIQCLPGGRVTAKGKDL